MCTSSSALLTLAWLGVGVAGVKLIEQPELAVCISGAVRSLATVPVLRGLKKNVLQSSAYTASAFAALSYDTTSPQLLEYNVSLAKQLALRVAVRRALGHLRPELQSATFYNTSSAVARFNSCRKDDATHPSTGVTALYGMQLCFSLVRTHEAARRDERFDFVLRVRPDHLILKALPLALGLNASSWPKGRLLSVEGIDVSSFALMPSGVLAAMYFRSFTAAASCLFREVDGAERLPASFPPALQCARLPAWDRLASCVVRANFAYHGLPRGIEDRHTMPGASPLIARICNLNATTNEPQWPAWPMPPGETCVTQLDALKRPRVIATYRPASGGAGGGGAGFTSWDVTMMLVFVGVAATAYQFRERLLGDALALFDMLHATCGPTLAQAYEAAAPHLEPLLVRLRPHLDSTRATLQPHFDALAARLQGARRQGGYSVAAVRDDDDA